MSLILPFADLSGNPEWVWWLVRASDMGQITELPVHQRHLELQLNNQGKATGWLHLLDDEAQAVEVHTTALRLDRDGETIWSGQVWQANEESQGAGAGQQSGSDKLNITAFGWFNVLGGSGQNCRLVHTGAEFGAMMWADYPTNTIPTPNYALWKAANGGVDYAQLGTDSAVDLAYSAVEFPQTTDAAIIFDLLDRANIDAPTLITRGNVYGSPLQRNLTLQRFQNVGQEITQLVNVEAGVDFVIDPVTRQMHLYGAGASLSSLIPNGYGYDRGAGCLFSYPGNCTQAQRSRDGTMTQNRIESVGQYGVGRSDDLGSQTTNGLLEWQASLPEVVDPNILTAYATAEIAVRAQPWRIVTLTPRAILAEDRENPGVPRPFTDYGLGDIVYGYVNRGIFQVGTTGSPQAMRVFGFSVDVSDDGTERTSAVQTTYQGSR